jgi:hypothetical protein
MKKPILALSALAVLLVLAFLLQGLFWLVMRLPGWLFAAPRGGHAWAVIVGALTLVAGGVLSSSKGSSKRWRRRRRGVCRGPCNEIVTPCDEMVTGLSHGVTGRVVYWNCHPRTRRVPEGGAYGRLKAQRRV